MNDDRENEHEAVPVLVYDESVIFPLHQAVINNDATAVQLLLQQQQPLRENLFVPVTRHQLGLASASSRKLLSNDQFTPVHLAVYLDRPHILRTLLCDTALVKMAESMDYTPLMLAAELGVDGCIPPLLHRCGCAAVMARDKIRGDTALHYVCRTAGASTTAILVWLNGQGQLQKPLLIRNHKGQTPFHVACEGGHTHLVEIFVQLCGPSLLQKLLHSQDDQRQTPLLAALAANASETVMTLLMWRGNYQDNGRFYRPSSMEYNDGPCPLVWAVAHGSLEMVHVLMEFSDADRYNLDTALQAAIRSTSESRHEIVRILIDAGANPGTANVGMVPVESSTDPTAFSIAAIQGDTHVLRILVDAYQQQLHDRQLTRRQDPKLQKQPESYFCAMEVTERSELQTSLCDALVRTLFLGWKESRLDCLQAAVLLFRKGTMLNDAGLARLKRSILEQKLKAADDAVATTTDTCYVYESDYTHFGMPENGDTPFQVGAYDKSHLSFWTEVLLHFSWMQEEDDIQCTWILTQQRLSGINRMPPSSEHLETVILIGRNCRFVAHSWILSQKCAKLEAAIRFAKISNDEGPIEINVDLTARQCKWFLQHMYSGSLLSGWGPRSDTCDDLFELALLAQEFLCPSLLQECEMRLLTSNVSQCFCWSCCLALRQSGTNSAQCLCRAQAGPSKVLVGNKTLDALALAQQLGGYFANEYRIKFSPTHKYPSYSGDSFGHAWNNYDSNACMLTTPFTAAKELAIRNMLLDYPEVLNSESFLSQVKSMIDDSDATEPFVNQALQAEVMLLQLCLDELAGSAMFRVETMTSKHRFIDCAVSTKSTLR